MALYKPIYLLTYIRIAGSGGGSMLGPGELTSPRMLMTRELYAMTPSVYVRLSVCLSVCLYVRMLLETRKQHSVFSKTKQFRAIMVPTDEQ